MPRTRLSHARIDRRRCRCCCRRRSGIGVRADVVDRISRAGLGPTSGRRSFATTEGIRVGSSEQRVLAAYPGRLARVPQKHVPDEDDSVLRQGNRKIIFTLADGKTSAISTGRTPEINLV